MIKVHAHLKYVITLDGALDASQLLANIAVALSTPPHPDLPKTDYSALRKLYDSLDREVSHIEDRDPSPWKDEAGLLGGGK